MTRLESAETKVEQVPPGDRKALQSFLGEIGAHLSDVFGADNVLWVEGTTEEICFPLILRKIANKRLMGTEIVAVRRTGDLESKDAARVFEIYDSLTASNSLIPPAIGFIFDTECRTEKELQDIKKRSKDLAVFLPRRMYENYLLNPAAVAHVASAVEGFRDEPITAKEVSAAIEAKRKDCNYYCSVDPKEMSDEQWIKRIDSAKILSDIFGELSENRVSYNKVIHSVELTRWLVEHSPEELREVADFLARVLAKKKSLKSGISG